MLTASQREKEKEALSPPSLAGSGFVISASLPDAMAAVVHTSLSLRQKRNFRCEQHTTAGEIGIGSGRENGLRKVWAVTRVEKST